MLSFLLCSLLSWRIYSQRSSASRGFNVGLYFEFWVNSCWFIVGPRPSYLYIHSVSNCSYIVVLLFFNNLYQLHFFDILVIPCWLCTVLHLSYGIIPMYMMLIEIRLGHTTVTSLALTSTKRKGYGWKMHEVILRLYLVCELCVWLLKMVPSSTRLRSQQSELLNLPPGTSCSRMLLT